jgi:hypothetical protein
MSDKEPTIHISAAEIPAPTEPGFYDVNLMSDGTYKVVKVGEYIVPKKKTSQRIAEIIGTTIGAVICIAIVAVGILFLIKWVFGL